MEAPVVSEERGGGARSSFPPARWILGATYVALVLPIVVALLDEVLHDRGLEETRADLALLEIGTDAASRGERLLGPYSQHGFAHPGPLGFYLLAPFLRLAAGHAVGLHLGAAFVAAIALVGFVRSFHRGPRDADDVIPSAWAAATALVSVAGWGLDHALGSPLSSPWNPSLATTATLVVAWLAARVVAGESSSVPWLVGAHALASQSHASAAVVATPVLLYAIARASRRGSIARRDRGLGLVIASLAWAPTIVDALTHRGGNLRAMVSFLAEPVRRAGGSFAFASALRAIGWPIHALVPSGFGRTVLIDAAFAGLLVSSALVVRRRVDARTRARIDVGLVGLLAAVVLVPSLRGLSMRHLAFPLGAMSLFLVGSLVHSFARSRSEGPWSARATFAAFAILATTSALAAHAQVAARRAADLRFRGEDEVALRIAAITRCVVRRSDVAITLASSDAWIFGATVARIAALEAGSPLLDPRERARFGPELTYGRVADAPERTNLVLGRMPRAPSPWSRDLGVIAITVAPPARGVSDADLDRLRRCLDEPSHDSPILRP